MFTSFPVIMVSPQTDMVDLPLVVNKVDSGPIVVVKVGINISRKSRHLKLLGIANSQKSKIPRNFKNRSFSTHDVSGKFRDFTGIPRNPKHCLCSTSFERKIVSN